MHLINKVSALMLSLFVVIIVTANPSPAQSKYFGNWEAGTSPQEVGKRVAESLILRQIPGGNIYLPGNLWLVWFVNRRSKNKRQRLISAVDWKIRPLFQC